MKKYISIISAAVLVSVCICSCKKENTIRESVSGEGRLALGVNINATKAAMTGEELLNTADVKIYMGDFSGLIREYKYGEAPSVIYLPADSYRVDVAAGELAKENPAVASFEQKSYKGSQDFTIAAGEVTNVEVVAKVANVITKVVFDQTVSELFIPGYLFSIGTTTDDATTRLAYMQSNSGSEGYFIVSGFEPSLYWKFSGNLSKDNSTVEKTGEIPAVEPGKLYTLKPKFTLKDGELEFTLYVDTTTDNFDDVITFEPVSTGLSSSKAHEIWAGHATVHADVDESEYSDPSKIKFSFSKNGSDWTIVNANRDSEGVYSAVLTGLTPNVDYLYRLVINEEVIGEAKTFHTATAPQLPNYGFETTSNAESSKWTSFYDPASSDLSLQTKFWDSGSSASAGMLGASYAICYSDTDVPAGASGSTRSARLQSLGAAGKLAAGNLFTGSFAGLDGLNGKVNFGRPWTSRPTAVRFWYKYNGGKVDKTASGCPLTTNDYDRFQIKVALGTWGAKTYGGTKESPVQVNTNNTSTFWNYPDLPETIAYGDLIETGNGSTSAWKQVTIALEYKDLTATPSHIVVSGAASQYGDYFAGSTSSALWIDEFELIYE